MIAEQSGNIVGLNGRSVEIFACSGRIANANFVGLN